MNYVTKRSNRGGERSPTWVRLTSERSEPFCRYIVVMATFVTRPVSSTTIVSLSPFLSLSLISKKRKGSAQTTVTFTGSKSPHTVFPSLFSSHSHCFAGVCHQGRDGVYSDCRLVILDSVTAVISPLLGGVKNPAGKNMGGKECAVFVRVVFRPLSTDDRKMR